MMKRLNWIRGLVLCLGILMMLCVMKESQAARYFSINAFAKDKTTVEINWKKQSVSGYEIYRAKRNKSGEYTYYQKIATISGKKKKYIDKTARYKSWYSYKVKAYKKQGNKKKYKSEESREVYTGVGTPNLISGYGHVCTTASSIKIEVETYGIAPTAFEIYRKDEAAKKYKKIKTVKVKSGCYRFEYVDKKVTKGKNYSYKVRAYKKIKGKKIYGKYSRPEKATAINTDATYAVENFTKENGKTKSIVVGLTSNEGNADTIFTFNPEYSNISYSYWENENSDSEQVDLVPVKYSFDNENWNPFPDKGVKLSEHQTIYIMLEEKDGKEFDFFSSGIYSSRIYWELTYHNVSGEQLSIDLIRSTAFLGFGNS